MGDGGASWTIVVQTCHGFGRERVFHVKTSPHGESWTGLSASLVTFESGIQPPVGHVRGRPLDGALAGGERDLALAP